MRKFLIVLGLVVIAAGVALSIIALVTAEDQSQGWQNNVGQSTCVVDTETTPAAQRCQFTIKTPYQGEMSLTGLTLALTGIGVEVAALALVAKPPAPPYFPNFGPVTARAG
ncbi:hypothetical protein SAMN05192558_10130 [Actinokineospora alba]|uniref:Uncharacterized protein n=1 Tax=Actinokineospora alba TaxID=504798 RepID=A0A1H0ENM3_9PSEU|nr:hypothetical protein [Actinokineospora alba]TDP69154.1 hypothetical protein C8E96_4727 [Actinokineospora alba]SDI23166.1 hypothetical protein SAMN05421871_103839 [Actinokineospora alba]SDN83950.1 hypothetical protein SAMN05192558_10130 [Actinokineospora alba]